MVGRGNSVVGAAGGSSTGAVGAEPAEPADLDHRGGSNSTTTSTSRWRVG